MGKIVESSYHTVDETIATVERLLSEGRTMDDIVIVTSNDNYSNIQNRTIVEVDKVSATADRYMWERFKGLFTDVEEKVALEHYGIDKQTALRYQDVLKAGNYVVLVEEDNGIPIRHHLEDGPKELGKASKEQRNKEPIGQSGSGTKVVTNTSDPSGEPVTHGDKDASLLNQEIDFSSEKYAGRKEDKRDLETGFKKARQEEPIGQSGSGVKKTKDSTLPDGESAMTSFEDRQINDQTVKEDKKRFSSETKDDKSENEQETMKNPLQGKPDNQSKSKNKNEIEYETEDISEDPLGLPRFSGNSITGQPVVDPLQNKEWE